MNEPILASDYVAASLHYLLLERADGSSEMYRATGEELERLEWRLKIMLDVDAWRKEGRAV